MKFDRGSAAVFRQGDLAINNAGAPKVAPLAPWCKDRGAGARAAAMLAFAAGLLVALGAAADEPARSQPTGERAGTDSVRVQPTAKQFAAPNQPDVSANDARTVDALYRLLIRPQPAAPSDSRSPTPSSGSGRE